MSLTAACFCHAGLSVFSLSAGGSVRSYCHVDCSVPPLVATGVDKHLQHLLGNEKLNFRVLSGAVHRLGGIPPLMTSSDMSNTLPDEKVSAQSAIAWLPSAYL